MTDSVNMSLDDIIKKNLQNRPGRVDRGRGGGNIRGRGGGRGGRRGRGGRGGGGERRRSVSRGRSDNRQDRSRSRSRGPRGRSQSRGRSQARGRSQSRERSQLRGGSQPRRRSQSRARSRSQQRRNSYPRTRSASRPRSQMRSITPKGRAGLENSFFNMPTLVRTNRGRGGTQMRLRRSNQQVPRGVHSRLGMNSWRGGANNAFKPLAVAKRGISKRGFGLTTRNRYSNIGLRSDQILQEQRQNSVIRSQTFTRSRNNSFSSASQLTVSVANDFAKRRRNSVGNGGYLNRQTLASLNNEFGGYNTRQGPGSVKSTGSNRSNRSNQSNSSRKSNRSRGRGRGRGGNRGIGRKFVNKQILDPVLQEEIAAIQGKSDGASNNPEVPSGINFTPTPAATKQTLHQRFATA
ncbi:uncharacterized protein DDB_G0287625-like [Maniola jurtina]|uniref:uncharacterized protein DDB_G0287625-like n=1 Tax=Maniola jurtina TaxID=191418 RepID=UPI001E68F1EB|nr:uncharacterized protein DDB_G0287625-like [Maniola jurtina]